MVTEAKDEKRYPSTLLIGNSGEIFAREGEFRPSLPFQDRPGQGLHCAAFIAIGVHRVPA
jgi:hypothetical protein